MKRVTAASEVNKADLKERKARLAELKADLEKIIELKDKVSRQNQEEKAQLMRVEMDEKRQADVVRHLKEENRQLLDERDERKNLLVQTQKSLAASEKDARLWEIKTGKSSEELLRLKEQLNTAVGKRSRLEERLYRKDEDLKELLSQIELLKAEGGPSKEKKKKKKK